MMIKYPKGRAGGAACRLNTQGFQNRMLAGFYLKLILDLTCGSTPSRSVRELSHVLLTVNGSVQ